MITRNRIEKGVEVIKFAIEKGISVSEASVKSGYANTFLKNVKRDLKEEHENGIVSEEDYDFFMSAYENYASQENKEDSSDPKNNTYRYEENGNSANVTTKTNKQIKTLEELIEVAQIDTNVWEVERWICNKWDIHGEFKDGENIKTNWQVKAWLKKKVFEILSKGIKEDFIEDAKKYAPKYEKIIYPKKENSKNLLEISIWDLHLGKLAWGEEVGEDYDSKIAKERFIKCLEGLLNMTKNFNYEKILFVIGNDFLNSDNRFNTTSNETFQDQDLRWQKIYRMGRELLVTAIDRLKKEALVDVISIPGNHDLEKSNSLADSIFCWYHNCKEVNVDNGPSLRKYYQYGRNLIGFCHGKDEKILNLPLLMASEVPDLWAETKFREFHLGHIHHKKDIKWLSTEEFNGVTVRFLRSLSGPEEWHYRMGFTKNIKAGEAFLWNFENGNIGNFSFNIE